jgi:kynureninase
VISFDDCVDLDRADPLREIRQQFDLPHGVVYLDGNSLGPPLRTVTDRVNRLLREWQQDLIAGWFERGWADLPMQVGRRLEPIIGAAPGSVVAADSTSVNLFKAAMVACDLRNGAILTDSVNFPTDLYVLGEVARRRNRQLMVVEPGELSKRIENGVALVALTQVDFRTGRLHDLGSITSIAHLAGALVLWDLSHSAGVMPIDLAANDVDLAVGCGYKYLNGGPGAPAYLFVHPRLAEELENPITGWFGHKAPFMFGPEYEPAAGVGRMQVGTPNVLSLVAFDEALSVFDDLDLRAVREKSVSITGFFVDLADQMLGDQTEVITPRVGSLRGSQITLRHTAAGRIVSDLAKQGVVGDFRPPGMMRFGFAPLFNRYADAWKAVSTLAAVVSSLRVTTR